MLPTDAPMHFILWAISAEMGSEQWENALYPCWVLLLLFHPWSSLTVVRGHNSRDMGVNHPLSLFSYSLDSFANLPNNIYISYQNYKTKPLMYIYDSIVNKYWCGYGLILCAGEVGGVICMSSFQASDHSRKIQDNLISFFKLYLYT